MRTPIAKLMPSYHARLHILLAAGQIAEGGVTTTIADQIIADSLGAVYVKQVTLYRLLHECVNAGLLELKGGFRTKRYFLTPKGLKTLTNEVKYRKYVANVSHSLVTWLNN